MAALLRQVSAIHFEDLRETRVKLTCKTRETRQMSRDRVRYPPSIRYPLPCPLPPHPRHPASVAPHRPAIAICILRLSKIVLPLKKKFGIGLWKHVIDATEIALEEKGEGRVGGAEGGKQAGGEGGWEGVGEAERRRGRRGGSGGKQTGGEGALFFSLPRLFGRRKDRRAETSYLGAPWPSDRISLNWSNNTPQ